jgi:indole-3-glycerol phosphate synthase
MRFSDAIIAEHSGGSAAVLPDIKCISPKTGDLLRGRNPVDVAKELVKYGAKAMSVVTESKNFGGSPGLLRDIVKNTGIPVLRKDFVEDEAIIKETAALGASAILLICATIGSEERVKFFYGKSLEYGVEPFVEVCNAEEMAWANRLGAKLIGINNRNIVTLELDNGDTGRTAGLASGANKGAVLVSESGILNRNDAELAVKSGANAVLVGTALWNAGDMGAMFQSLKVEI